ncbi:MAG: hypothetical protein V1758_03810 [Pseudomonadota bacterium]
MRGFLGRATLALLLAVAASCIMLWRPDRPKDYSRLVELIMIEDREEPLLVFSDFVDGFDAENYRANLKYLQEHPGLLREIQKDLDGGEIRWRLEGLSQRLLFVPEVREDYAALYESYCQDVINDILDKAGLDNPYHDIGILLEERPEISNEQSGVRAFLVHNLAKESLATYAFSNQEDKSVKMDLRGRQFVGEVGSFTTNIYLKEDGTFEFAREGYTIWQDSAKNPYTALMVPAEETMHIALREYTESAIKESLELRGVRDTDEVKKIAEEWMAVEEAVVGGCVHSLLPGILKRYLPDLPASMIEEDLDAKRDFKKYRHLKRGVEMVNALGYGKAIELYREDPATFKALLLGDGSVTSKMS